MVNQEATRLFAIAGITDAVIGKNVEEVVPNTNLHRVIETGSPELDQEQELNGVRILTNRLHVILEPVHTGNYDRVISYISYSAEIGLIIKDLI